MVGGSERCHAPHQCTPASGKESELLRLYGIFHYSDSESLPQHSLRICESAGREPDSEIRQEFFSVCNTETYY